MLEKIISIENVIDVTEDGILYKDSSGATNKVLFDECRKNWVEYVNQGGFTDWQGNPAYQSAKRILDGIIQCG